MVKFFRTLARICDIVLAFFRAKQESAIDQAAHQGESHDIEKSVGSSTADKPTRYADGVQSSFVVETDDGRDLQVQPERKPD